MRLQVRNGPQTRRGNILAIEPLTSGVLFLPLLAANDAAVI